MKKVLTALVLLVYLVPTSILWALYQLSAGANQNTGKAAFFISFVWMFLVCILVVISIASALGKGVQPHSLTFRAILVFKLCLIPFYVLNCACWVLASIVFHIAIFIWPMLPFIVAYTYFTLIGTSAHVIARLLALRRGKMITAKQVLIHSVMQVMFVADVIDSIYLAVKHEKAGQPSCDYLGKV